MSRKKDAEGHEMYDQDGTGQDNMGRDWTGQDMGMAFMGWASERALLTELGCSILRVFAMLCGT